MGLSDYEIKETVTTSRRSLIRRATRRRDGTSVILKSPSAEFPSAEELHQYQFEYHILQQLVMPGVVQAYALERNGNEIALVLEDFGGENLACGSQGLAMDEFFEVAVNIAEVLGEVHHRGVVHKDLKPRNLLLNRQTRQLKLIDFHVASELVRERREAEAPDQLQGSLPYMSPEQTGRMNRELDYRSDYYSFGITLFEMLTGDVPFRATDPMGWIHAHLSRRAPNVRRVRSDVPEMVATIVAKLLAKDPDERYQSARGLVSDLQECRRQWEATGKVEAFPLGAHDFSERFFVPQKVFGRGQELGCLLEALEKAIQGRTELVLLSGPLGVGKTALVEELRKSVVKRGGCYATGRSERSACNPPYGVFAQALRSVIQQMLSQPEERLTAWKECCLTALGGHGRVILELVPELEKVIGPQPALAQIAPAESQRRFRRVFGDFIRALATPTQPLVLFLDDLQWVHASTPELIGELLAHDGPGHILLVGAYRDSALVAGDALTLCLTTLRSTRADAVQELTLCPLDESSVNQLIAETLRAPERDTRSLTTAIYQKTAGNPLFTGELLMSLYRAGAFALDRNTGRWSFDLEQVRATRVSDNLAELMIDQLTHLPEAALEALKIAAVIGERFDVEALAEASGQSEAQIARALWEPIQQGIIVPLDGNFRLLYAESRDSEALESTARCQFQHERLQQVAYALLDETERIGLHF
ncbi:MAG TPA: AAA family ATPase, partial [Polyangiaceae bacterium]